MLSVASNKEDSVYNHSSQQSHTRTLDTLKQDFLAKYSQPALLARQMNEFDIIQTIGSGAFGTVFLVRDTSNLTYHAMKSIEKSEVIKKKTLKNILSEKKILQSIGFPFIVSMDWTCKDNVYVYFLLPFESGGELFSLIKSRGGFDEQLAKFYAAQVVLSIEYLHHCGVVHRDIKPENILISVNGYIKLSDFGISKVMKNRTFTICGTPEYIAPEVILSKGYSFPVDWWALGVLIYEMVAGHPPFHSPEPMQLYEKIIAGQYRSPALMTTHCKILIKHLLEVNPSKRYGSLKVGVYDIKSHQWFIGLCWNSVFQQKLISPYVPVCKGRGDTSHFRNFSETKIKKSPVCLYDEEFKYF